MIKCLPEFEYFYCVLENKNIVFNIRRSKVTDYAALSVQKSDYLCHMYDYYESRFNAELVHTSKMDLPKYQKWTLLTFFIQNPAWNLLRWG